MTVTLTYDSALARVRITANGLAAADYATVERSTDQIKWTYVRGGTRVALSASAFAATLDDYEFTSGTPNFYRVRGVEVGPITFVGAGTAATGNNTSVVPGDPAGLVVGDLKVTLASIGNSGTGTVNTPAGWTLMRAFGNMAFLGRRHQAGDSAPTVTFAGGAAGADTLARTIALRRADLTPVAGADQLNGSAQDIGLPALTVPLDNLVILLAAWKQDDFSAAAFPVGTGIGATSSTAGNDAAQALAYQIQTLLANIAAATATITGGAAAISRAMVVALQHAPFLNEQTASLTPVLDRIWVKSVTRPFLNRPFRVINRPEVERPGRGNDFEVVGRTLPVAVTDVAGGKVFDADIYCATSEEVQTLDYLVASGDLLYLHTPAGCAIPGGHVRVDAARERSPNQRAATRVFTLSLRQVAAPGPDVVGATSTWQTVLNSYASWADVLAANATWADLIARVAAPSEVIVP